MLHYIVKCSKFKNMALYNVALIFSLLHSMFLYPCKWTNDESKMSGYCIVLYRVCLLKYKDLYSISITICYQFI